MILKYAETLINVNLYLLLPSGKYCNMKEKRVDGRETIIEKIANRESLWDLVIIGGGATGLGAALDSASRGYKTLLLEQHDFAKGTSSRSTKLVHGGVRYLAQGNIPLVLEALRERGRLQRNAPHLVKKQAFVIPCYTWWCVPFYTIGLTLYDLMAGNWALAVRFHFQKKESFMPALHKIRRAYGAVSGITIASLTMPGWP